MKLCEFLNRLFTEGIVEVPRQLAVFQEDDLWEAVVILKQFYAADQMELAFEAPAFDESAALWASQYIFHAIQFILLRELEEPAMIASLQAYDGAITPNAIYSVDLIFRYLGPVFKLSSGLAPNDPLVNILKVTAAQWPYSSVGLNVEPTVDTNIIFSHPSLKYTYVDRIIQHRDRNRINSFEETQTLKEILGIHQKTLWPGLDLLPQPNNTL